jgi:2-hydroxychromene-2-carboxylate isomerase
LICVLGLKSGEENLMKNVEFIFDFASPNAYLVLPVLRDIVARTRTSLTITPCLLGGIFKATGNQAPMIAFAPVKGKMDYEMLETRRFIAAHGFTKFSMNPHFPINSIHAIRGLIAAQKVGVADGYLDAILSGFWEQGAAMGDITVIADVLNKAGLDGTALMEATANAEVKATLIANTENAVARGAFGIPTFFVGADMYFGKERLGQVEAALRA